MMIILLLTTWLPAAAKPGAKDFIAITKGMNLGERESVIRDWIRLGYMPDFLWDWQPVDVSQKIDGRMVKAKIWVTPNYFSLGNDQDFLLMPVNFHTVSYISQLSGFMIPTRRIVAHIQHQAKIKSRAFPLPPSAEMVHTSYYAKHHHLVMSQISVFFNTGFMSGHKKDIVLSNKLKIKNNRIAIYGWNSRQGQFIQPLSTCHGSRYVDYSHGVRLVSPMMEVDNKILSYSDVLSDEKLWPLLSDEGPMHVANLFPDSGIDKPLDRLGEQFPLASYLRTAHQHAHH